MLVARASFKSAPALSLAALRAAVEHIATLIPDEWLEPAATGSAQQCAARVRQEFDYGADAVIMHGATPDELDPIIKAYRENHG